MVILEKKYLLIILLKDKPKIIAGIVDIIIS